MQEVCENIGPSFYNSVCLFVILSWDGKYSAFHYRQIYTGNSAYSNRVDPDFTANNFETADEVNVLLKPYINLPVSTTCMLQRHRQKTTFRR
jgi:hypothetical protein